MPSKSVVPLSVFLRLCLLRNGCPLVSVTVPVMVLLSVAGEAQNTIRLEFNFFHRFNRFC
jgi:hypothetical protein